MGNPERQRYSENPGAGAISESRGVAPRDRSGGAWLEDGGTARDFAPSGWVADETAGTNPLMPSWMPLFDDDEGDVEVPTRREPLVPLAGAGWPARAPSIGQNIRAAAAVPTSSFPPSARSGRMPGGPKNHRPSPDAARSEFGDHPAREPDGGHLEHPSVVPMSRHDAQALRQIRRSWLPAVFTAILALLAMILFIRGASYYGTPLLERAIHGDYRSLSPGGMVGHGYGIFGTALIFANLLYLVRRRMARFRNLGSLRVWLDVHVFTGLAGAVLILFHSAFQLRSPIAVINAVSLSLVIATGVLGRMLHAVAPKTVDRQLDDNLVALDAIVPGLGTKVRADLRGRPITEVPANASLFRMVRTIPTWFVEVNRRRAAVRTLYAHYAADLDFVDAYQGRRIVSATRWWLGRQALAHMAAILLDGWRGLHRFFALLMIVSTIIHIAVAWYFGYRWVFSE